MNARTAGKPAKYAPLQRYLAAVSGDTVTLSVAEIEAIIGAPLPQTAVQRQWWANHHKPPQGRAWLAAGWQTSRVPQRR